MKDNSGVLSVTSSIISIESDKTTIENDSIGGNNNYLNNNIISKDISNNSSNENLFCNDSLRNELMYHYSNDQLMRYEVVQQFINKIVDAGTFSLNKIRRAMIEYIYNNSRSTIVGDEVGMYKPSGLDVYEMYTSNPIVFGCGSIRIPTGSHPLKSEKILYYHNLSCDYCRSNPSNNSDCYIHNMIKCIDYGWLPPIDHNRIEPLYEVNGNYKNVSLYNESTSKEILDMINNGVLIPCNPCSRVEGIVTPLGAVLKNSDKLRAKTLVGIDIVDQASLTEASSLLVAGGHNKVKVRITTDCAATGINRVTYSPPFSYPILEDGIKIVKRNCYLGKTDIGRYFLSFPLAFDIRHLFRIIFAGIMYMYARCCFGFTLCSYYCSTWSAEIRQWMIRLVGPCAHMVDDWLFVGDTESEVKEKVNLACAIIVAIGFIIAIEKNEFGQRLNYLGVLLDTVSMMCRIDPTQAKGMRIQLEIYIERIISNKVIDKGTVNSVCGKLNWFSEVLQSGRAHIKSWWDYHKHGSNLCSVTKNRLIADTEWWIGVLAKWENDLNANIEYPMWSSDEIMKNPRSIYICQSDASGTDGFGYLHGFYRNTSIKYVSKRWLNTMRPDDSNSHYEELYSLLDFMNSVDISKCILLWITDSQSAAYSVNKGNCKSVISFKNLKNILELCDNKQVYIVALWVPREYNRLADYLSHLSSYMNRDTVSGEL